MEAGIEHLGRGTVRGVDALLVVVEADRRTLETAGRIVGLAREIGLSRILAVGNKLRTPEEENAIRAGLLEGIPLLSALPYQENLRTIGAAGALPQGPPPAAVQELFALVQRQIVSVSP